jgi:hypothetical protein
MIDLTGFSVCNPVGFWAKIERQRRGVGNQLFTGWFVEDGRQRFIETLTEGDLERRLDAEVSLTGSHLALQIMTRGFHCSRLRRFWSSTEGDLEKKPSTEDE